MKQETPKVTKLDTITDLHRRAGLPGPAHPMITLVDARQLLDLCRGPESYVLGFYMIIFVTKLAGKFRYGQGHYDFDEGSLVFAAPQQLLGKMDTYSDAEGLSLYIHPDFFQGYPLAAKIKQLGMFSYAANESLYLSEQEKATMTSIFNIIREELANRIDDFSREVTVAQIELLLSYAKRFHKRQFLTRQVVNNDFLQQFEELLNKYFEDETAATSGMPTVQYLAEALNFSPNYLSDMLRSLTGLNAQQHIHQKLIERSKDLLSTTTLTINEVAYKLGFEYPQSFSRLFKLKTTMSPAQFRSTFN